MLQRWISTLINVAIWGVSVIGQMEIRTYHQCAYNDGFVTFSCPDGSIIDVQAAVISTSEGWTPGKSCPYTSPECDVNSTDTYELCDGRKTCNMSQEVIEKDPGKQCFAPNFIQINYTCENIKAEDKTKTTGFREVVTESKTVIEKTTVSVSASPVNCVETSSTLSNTVVAVISSVVTAILTVGVAVAIFIINKKKTRKGPMEKSSHNSTNVTVLDDDYLHTEASGGVPRTYENQPPVELSHKQRLEMSDTDDVHLTQSQEYEEPWATDPAGRPAIDQYEDVSIDLRDVSGVMLSKDTANSRHITEYQGLSADSRCSPTVYDVVQERM